MTLQTRAARAALCQAVKRISVDDFCRRAKTIKRSAILSAINDEFIPAYRKFLRFVRNDYAPHGRTEPGVGRCQTGKRDIDLRFGG